VRGKLEIDSDYDFGKDLQVTVTVTDITDIDQQDGTINRIYKARLLNE